MIDQYFWDGFKFKEIIALLERFHGDEIFILYMNYCESKSSQKRIQSPVLDTFSFIQGISPSIGYRSSIAKMNKKLDECFSGICCINNERT